MDYHKFAESASSFGTCNPRVYTKRAFLQQEKDPPSGNTPKPQAEHHRNHPDAPEVLDELMGVFQHIEIREYVQNLYFYNM